MTLQISRDATGRVTITDPSTGKSEVVATRTAGRATAAAIKPLDSAPSFGWDQRTT